MIYDKINTTLGYLIVVSDGERLSEIAFESESSSMDVSDLKKDPTTMRPITSQIEAYLKGELKRFDLPLHLSGTPFQKSVWSELIKIPFGETRSYQDIAKAVGSPSASRAVGSACGKNPVPIVVPCHRVITKSGGLGGYSGGLGIKKTLLKIEGLSF
ncbi:MAG: methylated-DNA--[protein]-cysteine S-methyltransferase [Desulfobacteraceae bacterium]|jgi:O-6-methylguanine DNA methyltransferase